MKKNRRLTGTAIVLMAAITMVLIIASCPSPTGPSTNAATYRVTYHANGEPMTVPSPQSAVAGSAVNVAAPLGYNPITAPKIFNGWNTERDGSGSSYSPGQTMTVNRDINLYAKWATAGDEITTFKEYTIEMVPEDWILDVWSEPIYVTLALPQSFAPIWGWA